MDVTEPNAFAGLLGLVFAGAALAGSALDPDPDPRRPPDRGHRALPRQSKARVSSDIRFAVEYPSQGRYRPVTAVQAGRPGETAAFTREIGDGHGH
jgi:hypothetical protein